MDADDLPEGPPLDKNITLFLCGDVMTGRGIDQVLPCPVDPGIHEPYMKNAVDYVRIAEQANGAIRRPVDFAYLWGDALEVLNRARPDIRFINLETSITTSDRWEPKGINYRMHPKNIACITAARIDGCSLANNHVLDWGKEGLLETLTTLEKAGIKRVGAGRNLIEAEAHAILPAGDKGRVILLALGTASSGIPPHWAAMANSPGVNLKDLSDQTVARIAKLLEEVKRPQDIAVISVHWGGNWGYQVPHEHQVFAHKLIDSAGVDVVHGHSSHHPVGLEVYRHKPIFYGCGDFLNDYEGIHGYDVFRQELTLMYFPSIDPLSGNLASLRLVPMQISQFRLNRVSEQDALWLKETLNQEGQQFRTNVKMDAACEFTLQW